MLRPRSRLSRPCGSGMLCGHHALARLELRRHHQALPSRGLNRLDELGISAGIHRRPVDVRHVRQHSTKELDRRSVRSQLDADGAENAITSSVVPLSQTAGRRRDTGMEREDSSRKFRIGTKSPLPSYV